MSLIKCIECGKEFSDKALACPKCGCPISHILKYYDDLESSEILALKENQLQREQRHFKTRENIKLNFTQTLDTKAQVIMISDVSTISVMNHTDHISIQAKDILSISQQFGSIIHSGFIQICTTNSDYKINYGTADNQKINELFKDIASDIGMELFEKKEPENKIKKSSPVVSFSRPTITKTMIVANDSRKSAGSAITRAAVGGLFLGPIGLLGGGISGKNKKTTTFLVFYSDGHKETITVKTNGIDFKRYVKYLE